MAQAAADVDAQHFAREALGRRVAIVAAEHGIWSATGIGQDHQPPATLRLQHEPSVAGDPDTGSPEPLLPARNRVILPYEIPEAFIFGG